MSHNSIRCTFFLVCCRHKTQRTTMRANENNSRREISNALRLPLPARARVLSFLICLALSLGAAAQQIPANEESQPLVLVRIIPLPGAEGRFDHMAVDVKGSRIFAAIYGNDTVEVMDVRRATRIHTIREIGRAHV